MGTALPATASSLQTEASLQSIAGGSSDDDSSTVQQSSPREESNGTSQMNTYERPKQLKPWYTAGGMEMNMVGNFINVVCAVSILGSTLDTGFRNALIVALLCSYTAATLTSHTVYCIIIVPTYFTSTFFLTFSLENYTTMVLLLALSVVLAIAKVNICMSVCLHRYAAHAAFRCGPVTHVGLCLLGCLANQGGPLWWASQHRCHHKYCELPRDPHSPSQVGTEAAFCFFHTRFDVEEEFVPRHMASTWLRVLDLLAWMMVSLEMVAAYLIFGREGLFVAYTSGWICQSITLWFNIANHPPDNKAEKPCTATDYQPPMSQQDGLYLPFQALDALYPLFSLFVMEGEHETHHLHASLAKRSETDLAYWCFVKPLEVAGLVWNVIV